MKKIGFLIIRILVVIFIISIFAPPITTRWLKNKREDEANKRKERDKYCKSHPDAPECQMYTPIDIFGEK